MKTASAVFIRGACTLLDSSAFHWKWLRCFHDGAGFYTTKRNQVLKKKPRISCLLNNLGLSIPVFGCEQEIRAHVQGTFRADIIAL